MGLRIRRNHIFARDMIVAAQTRNDIPCSEMYISLCLPKQQEMELKIGIPSSKLYSGTQQRVIN